MRGVDNMDETIIEHFDLTKDEIKENINSFIVKNSDNYGIDLSKIYFAFLTYAPYYSINESKFEDFFGINCPVNTINDFNKVPIVFILKSQSNEDHIFIDIFNESLLQSTCVNVERWLSLMAQYRRGTTVSQFISLEDILGIDRLNYQGLELIYSVISGYSKDDIIKFKKEELRDLLLSAINNTNIKHR